MTVGFVATVDFVVVVVVHLRGEKKYCIFLQVSSTVSCRGFGDA